jgi:hypothetical protein
VLRRSEPHCSKPKEITIVMTYAVMHVSTSGMLISGTASLTYLISENRSMMWINSIMFCVHLLFPTVRSSGYLIITVCDEFSIHSVTT